MINLIFDFESFGQSVMKCALINCSFFLFDTEVFTSEEPYTYEGVLEETYHLKLDVQAQVTNGYIVEKSSLDFWSKVDPEAKKQLVPSTKDLTYAQFCDRLISYLDQYRKIDYWWSRSNTFDPILLWRIFEDSGRIEDLNKRLRFWRVRDIRTFIDSKTDFSLDHNGFTPLPQAEWDRKFKAHDSRHDITADVLRLQKLARLENGLE